MIAGGFIDDLSVPIAYIVGPPQMLAEMQSILAQVGVKSDGIGTEQFVGY